MITPIDIKSLVSNGEGYHVEFKVSVPSKIKELTQEICAFANAAGGVILIGIDDKNTIVGASINNTKRSTIQHSIGDISPTLKCDFSIVEVDGKEVGVIEVPSGPNKPYVLSGSIFVRIGPNSQKLTTAEQMRDFFQQSDKIFFDEVTCKNFDFASDLDEATLNVFKNLAHFSDGISNEQIFSNLKIITDDHLFKNGAVLFFGKQPEHYFDHAIVRCLVFKGKDKRYIIDDKIFGGPLYNQYQKSIQWLKEKMNLRYDIEGQGFGPRKEFLEIPETVFKEALINSLSHRDYYDKGATTMVEVYDDRVEISNPGGLVNAIKPSDFGKKSVSRNPLIFGMFSRMQLVEQVGSGIIRMRSIMLESGLPVPIFSTEGIFTITLKRPIEHKTNQESLVTEPLVNYTGGLGNKLGDKLGDKHRSTSRDKILEILKANNQTTMNDLAESLNLSYKGIEYHINELKKEGIIRREGSRKKGLWIVIHP